MRAVPHLCIYLYPGIRLTTEENHGKTSVGAAEKRLTQVLGTIRLVDLVAVSRATSTGRLAVITFGLHLG
jgi:hypothetical protein